MHTFLSNRCRSLRTGRSHGVTSHPTFDHAGKNLEKGVGGGERPMRPWRHGSGFSRIQGGARGTGPKGPAQPAPWSSFSIGGGWCKR